MELAGNHDIEVNCPRVLKKQVHRSNIEASNPKEYYNRNVFIPFLDILITEMKTRFSPAHADIINLFSLIPSFAGQCSEMDLIRAAKKYCDDVSELMLKNEVAMWREQWKEEKNPPATAIDSFCSSVTRFYPNIQKMLHLLCILPVTSCTGERSFSTMKLIKTYLRSTMMEDRLNGLALLNIHKKTIKLEPSDVIDKFAKLNPRRMQLM